MSSRVMVVIEALYLRVHDVDSAQGDLYIYKEDTADRSGEVNANNRRYFTQDCCCCYDVNKSTPKLQVVWVSDHDACDEAV